MKNTITTIAIITFLLFNSIGFSQNKVAVFNPEDKGNTGFGNMIHEIINTEITKSGYYTLIAKESLDNVILKNNIQSIGMNDDQKAIEFGGEVGANLVCLSMIEKIEKQFFITAKLVNTVTGEVEFQEYIKTKKGEKDLVEVISGLVQELTNTEIVVVPSKEMSSDELPVVEIDFVQYMVMPKDFHNRFNWEKAVKACEDLNAYGHDDWFLPTKEQLYGMFLKKKKIGGFSSRINYWSSTVAGDKAWVQDFEIPVYGEVEKIYEQNVRCIRKAE
jgi:hypothetical protein